MLPPVYHCHYYCAWSVCRLLLLLPPVFCHCCYYYCAWSVCVGGAARKVPAKLDVSCSCVMIITVRGVCIV